MGVVTEVAPETTAASNGPGRTAGRPNVAKQLTFQVVPTLPPKRASGFARTSAAHKALEEIVADPNLHGQAIELYTYGDDERARGSAAATATGLRKTYSADDGWVFRVGESQIEQGKVALVVQYM